MFFLRNFNINNNLKFFNVYYVYCILNFNIFNFLICKYFVIFYERIRLGLNVRGEVEWENILRLGELRNFNMDFVFLIFFSNL